MNNKWKIKKYSFYVFCILYISTSFVIEYKFKGDPLVQNLFSTSGVILLLGSAFIQYRIDGLAAKLVVGNECVSSEMLKRIADLNKKIRKEKLSTYIALTIGTLITIYGNQIFYILSYKVLS